MKSCWTTTISTQVPDSGKKVSIHVRCSAKNTTHKPSATLTINQKIFNKLIICIAELVLKKKMFYIKFEEVCNWQRLTQMQNLWTHILFDMRPGWGFQFFNNYLRFVSVLYQILLMFFNIFLFLCVRFWPHLCLCEAGLLCEYLLSSIRFILMTCFISCANVL